MFQVGLAKSEKKFLIKKNVSCRGLYNQDLTLTVRYIGEFSTTK